LAYQRRYRELLDILKTTWTRAGMERRGATLLRSVVDVAPAGFDEIATFIAKDGCSLAKSGSIGWCAEREDGRHAVAGMLVEEMGVDAFAHLEAPTAEALGDCEALALGGESMKQVIVIYTDTLGQFAWHGSRYRGGRPSSEAYRKARSFRDQMIADLVRRGHTVVFKDACGLKSDEERKFSKTWDVHNKAKVAAKTHCQAGSHVIRAFWNFRDIQDVARVQVVDFPWPLESGSITFEPDRLWARQTFW